jgi:rod shape-determining protein MreD
MRPALGLLAFGLVALVLQGVLTVHVPVAWVPNLSLLVAVALGLHLEASGGLVVAGSLGYAADLFSGSLLGQHALLRALACVGTRLANQGLDLRRFLPLAVFAGLLTLGEAAAVGGLTTLFAGRAVFDRALAVVLGQQLVVNALAAPLVCAAAGRVVRWTLPEESLRRSVRLEPRRPMV